MEKLKSSVKIKNQQNCKNESIGVHVYSLSVALHKLPPRLKIQTTELK
jgi:hypothetical protein